MTFSNDGICSIVGKTCEVMLLYVPCVLNIPRYWNKESFKEYLTAVDLTRPLSQRHVQFFIFGHLLASHVCKHPFPASHERHFVLKKRLVVRLTHPTFYALSCEDVYSGQCIANPKKGHYWIYFDICFNISEWHVDLLWKQISQS